MARTLRADPSALLIAIRFCPGALRQDIKRMQRSTVEWVLEHHKERKPKDPTIREKFDAYRFTDYKEQVIDLLRRVCTVRVETMNIIGEMNAGG